MGCFFIFDRALSLRRARGSAAKDLLVYTMRRFAGSTRTRLVNNSIRIRNAAHSRFKATATHARAETESVTDNNVAPPRIVTAASLFDGHDAAINVMRRLLQSSGAEVIHLGHDRSANDVVRAAIQEDANAIALTSYQGGHMEYFKYIHDLLTEAECAHIKIYGGGGGTISPPEVKELMESGITRIYSPEDGRIMGLEGMIQEVVDGAAATDLLADESSINSNISAGTVVHPTDHPKVARLLTMSENFPHEELTSVLDKVRSRPADQKVPVIGMTGTGGAGKSSLIDELMLRALRDNPEANICLLCVDPTRKRTGGALLGDRIRMNSLNNERLFMRSLATRGSNQEISERIEDAIAVAQATGFDIIFVETSGIGQGNDAITQFVDVSIYVMTSEFGAESQLEKIEMLDVADFIVLNKFEKLGAIDALRSVRKQVRMNKELWNETDAELPVIATVASQFANPSVDNLWSRICQHEKVISTDGVAMSGSAPVRAVGETPDEIQMNAAVVPTNRALYLQEITETVRNYHADSAELEEKMRKVQHLETAAAHLAEVNGASQALEGEVEALRGEVPQEALDLVQGYRTRAEAYRAGHLTYTVRGKDIHQPTTTKSLSHSDIPRVAMPDSLEKDDGQLVRWLRSENQPGFFPFTAGVFPLKRTDEEPRRQFAGEGSAARTNARFHYLSENDDAKRLSTAFDSVTLYGRDPSRRLDVYGKVGESGVSIFSVEEMDKLFEGFDLCHPNTSVSMTINGPAPTILAMFFNTAINQQTDKFRAEMGRDPDADEAAVIRASTISQVRGTVQADILKEDQAQNTCIFSTEFSLRCMGDVQQYYIENNVKNHYSVSISGYHIAEAGANPITQLALTLANGFTYVEYYKSRGMDVDAFAPNLSFFFSNGLDPEYTVIGRVARRIWSIAMRDMYGCDEKGQKLKYHIQTSGRSLHAQEVHFNDIRTTLQALLAIQDQCNSLHTNAYDEAVTTPTEQSVRQAMAIQMIINRESGWAKCENTLQGSFFAEQLTDMVEEAVLQEFERLSARGGVLGAMESQYQRGKIQEESMHYEMLKHTGELPIIGVNTYHGSSSADALDANNFDMELVRASPEEKDGCLGRLDTFHEKHKDKAPAALKRLQDVARADGNLFEELMETTKVASLGQITQALFEVGGQYRRNM